MRLTRARGKVKSSTTTSPSAPHFRILSTVLFCVTLTGAVDAAASGGPVVAWGRGAIPDAVNGVSGTATDIAAGDDHSCAIQAGTDNVVCWGRDDIGEATPPDAVNGVSGTATEIATGNGHTLAIVGGSGPTATPTPAPSGRVAVCHNGKRSISVSANAAPAHLEHGDTLGACP